MYIDIYLYVLYICMYVCMYVCMYTYVYVYVSIFMYGARVRAAQCSFYCICFWTTKFFFVYYEETKRELKRILIYECRCNERLKAKTERS